MFFTYFHAVLMKKIKTWIYRVKFQLIAILFIWISIFFVIKQEKKWNYDSSIASDVAGYYGYLPAQFIQHDLRLNYFHDSLMVHRWQFWPVFTPEGHRVIKYTMGMSYLYLPMFATAHWYAKIKGYSADGYSKPYQRNMQYSAWFYLFFGLWFLWKYLEQFFSKLAIAITLMLITFGTNLFYYLTWEPGFPHAFDFTLFAILLYTSHRHAISPSLRKLAVITLVLCLLTLIRPVNFLAVFVFFFPNRISFSEVKSRFAYLLSKKISFIIIGIIGIAVFLPQLLYWKYVTGNWTFYTYGNETFDFTNPQFINGLFSYKKGWLIYSPLFLFLVPGFYFLYKKNRHLFWNLLVFTFVYMYVIWSWWAWYYGGCFGNRAMIDIYALLAIPLVAFIDWLISAKIYWRFLLVLPLTFVVWLNLFQTYQYKHGIIHWNGMDKETYWKVFGKEFLTEEELKFCQERWIQNDK